jgi:hypothetical protein
VRDDRALHGQPWIDIEIAAFTKETGFGHFDQHLTLACIRKVVVEQVEL